MRNKWISLVLIVALSLSVVPGGHAQANTWQVWEKKDLKALGNDKTGATFAISTNAKTPGGTASTQIMPSGKSEETKLTFDVSGADLADWPKISELALEVYLPEKNALNANRFFLGMADATSAWTWVAGVFSATEGKAGWNRVVYPLAPAMQKTKPDGKYTLYFSFFNEVDGKKTPLIEPLYVGSAYLTGATTTAGDPDRLKTEVDALLKMDDKSLVAAIARQTFEYFWTQADPQTGLIKDRSTADSPASIAAVGFGLTAITIGVDRGWISHDEGYQRALLTLKTFSDGLVKGNAGFFYHFINMQTGERVWGSEVSSIDTALFIAGALSAGQYFKGTDVEALAQTLYQQIDWKTFADGGNLVSMGWKPDTGFYSNTWDHFDESLLLYILAIGSPTHPVSAEAWAQINRPVYVSGDAIYLPGEPLFVYQYPLTWIDLKDREDAFANYFNNTTHACQRNREFSAGLTDTYKTYRDGVWGLSAGDGPQGYRAYGASRGNNDGTISPYASIACLPFTPKESLESIRAMLNIYGTKAWGEYGFVSGINAQVDWYSSDAIGIDEGDILLMIANYQDGFVWKLMSQNKDIQTALSKIGFVNKKADYAVTPAYLANFK